MIRRLTRWLIALQLIAAAVVGWICFHFLLIATGPAFLAGLIAVVVVRLAIVANNFIISKKYGSPTPARFALNPWQRCQLFFREFVASMASSSWLMPFLSLSSSDRLPSATPVLLVHGYGCNSAYWIPMSKALTHAGIAHDGVDMEPLLADIDTYAAIIHEAVEEMLASTGRRRLVIVAHSMGGLAVRAYMRKHGNERIAKVITLGTPHHGTVLGNFGIGTNSRQMGVSGQHPEDMRPADWLRQLAESESPETRALFVSIYSHHDNIVVPQTSSHLPGARNIEFGGIGHVTLAFDTQIQRAVIGEILQTSEEKMQPGESSSIQSRYP